MNDILSKLEQLNKSDLSYIFEYTIQLINMREEEKRLKLKHSKMKENLITNSRVNITSVQSAGS